MSKRGRPVTLDRRRMELEARMPQLYGLLTDRQVRRAHRGKRCPKTAADCDLVDSDQPCPWVRCRYHLYGEVCESGSLRIYHPDVEPHEMAEPCALRLVRQRGGPLTLQEIGGLLNVSRERVRQIESLALRRLRRTIQREGGPLWAEYQS